MRQNLLLAASVVALTVALMPGCGGSDCTVACERSQECIEDDLDLDECIDECEDAYEDDDDIADEIVDCAECVEPRTCSELLDSCGDDCLVFLGVTASAR